ncbi:ATP-binding protein [Corynebacterium cystitidis]|uniref:ATP-binding protein n=1 Tax=Corynebacterium cystitidis TaxID=35757 RepID=UPI00211F0C8E|nr:ATP-binding protein [Corynebacterium cystitidis]
MSFIPRDLSSTISQFMEWFPVVSVTGPRQSGKSTLIREQLADFTYLNLEDPAVRSLSIEDPVGFIRDRGEGLIIDEVQHSPELFSVLQVVSDERGTPGQYVISGSQNFLLMEKVSQSLAGRVGLTHLLPLSFREVRRARPEMTVEDFMVRGGYPRLYQLDMPAGAYFQSYVQTYLQRDVSQLLKAQNLGSFRQLLGLLALNAGQLVNYTGLARELGVSFATVKNWVSILESSFVIFTLRPFYVNSRKKLTKTPKLYFYDTGLLCHLLGISSKDQLVDSPSFGAACENLVVSETAKHYLHEGKVPELYFYRDDSKAEIDLLDMTAAPTAIEIKSSATFRPKYARHLTGTASVLGIPVENRHVVYRGAYGQTLEHYVATPMEEYLLFSQWHKTENDALR